MTESRGWRLSVLGSFYTMQGLLGGFLGTAVMAWLTRKGLDTDTLAEISAIVGVPGVIKLFWAPLIDRHTFRPMGRRRPWILAFYLAAMLSVLALSFVPEPTSRTMVLACLMALVYLCMLIVDVAADGLAIDVLKAGEHGQASSVMFLGRIVGAVGGAVAMSPLLGKLGFQGAVLCLLPPLALLMLLPLGVRERPGERLLPWSQGEAADLGRGAAQRSLPVLFKELWAVMRLSTSALCAVLCLLGLAMSAIQGVIGKVLIIQHLGWTDTEYSQILGGVGALGALLGALLSGALLERVGYVRTFVLCGAVSALGSLLFAALPGLWTERAFIVGHTLFFGVFSAVTAIAWIAVLMRVCWQQVGATQFALFMALLNLSGVIGARLAGPLDAALEFQHIYALAGVFLLVLMGVASRISLERARGDLEALDARHLPAP